MLYDFTLHERCIVDQLVLLHAETRCLISRLIRTHFVVVLVALKGYLKRLFARAVSGLDFTANCYYVVNTMGRRYTFYS